MIVLKTPKGWTGPKEVDGLPVEGTYRAHQVPLSEPTEHPEHLKILEAWMRSYRPEELFDEEGRLVPELRELAPKGERRMGANPIANGGILLRDLRLANFRDYAIDVHQPGNVMNEDARTLGKFLRDAIKLNAERRNFRIFGPDETASNRLTAVFEVTNKQWIGAVIPTDDHLSPDGRVVEMLSEHQCEGWLEGYLLTGRPGIFNTYEAFVHVIDWMFNQHAKWLKVTRHLPWRRPIASLNILLASHVWRQDHNGFTHQDPGFIDHVCNKKAEVIRVYLPPDTNCLLSVPQEPARARLQGGGDDQHGVRHDGHERPRPVSSRGGRDRSPAPAWRQGRVCQAGRARQADRAPAVHHQVRRGHARDPELEVDGNEATLIEGGKARSGPERANDRRGQGAIAPVPQISAEFRCFSTLTWPELARRML